MHGSGDPDPTMTSVPVVCGTSTSALGRVRDLQIALRAAKVNPGHREIVVHLAAHCDKDGATFVSLKRIARNLGFRARSTVWEAVEAARVAGFVERVTTDDRDLWIIPLMRGPGTAHLREQVRGKSEEVRGPGTAQGARSWDRAPSEVPVSNRRRAKNGAEVAHTSEERSAETIAAIHDLRRQLRRRA